MTTPQILSVGLVLVASLLGAANASAEGGGLLYQFDKTPIHYALTMNQRVEVDLGAGSRQTGARINARVSCALEKTTPEGDLVVGLRFSDLSGEFTAQGKPITGVDLSQLGVLRSSATLKPTGSVTRTLMPSANRQIDRTFRLLQDAFLRSLPVLPEGGEAAIGATWQDTRTERYEVDDRIVETKLSRTFKLVKVDPKGVGSGRLARIEIQISLETTSRMSDDKGSPLERLGSATGKGHALFDLDAGHPREVHLEVDHQSKDNTGARQRTALTFDLAYAPEG